MKALVIDDQDAVRTALSLLLDLHGIECLSASTPEEALDLVRREDVGVAIQDMNFSKDTTSGEEGIALFREIHELDPELPVILLTAWTSLESAVMLVKEGAADYLAKPWDDQKLVVTVQNLMNLRQARDENRRLKGQDERSRRDIAKRFDLRGLVYQSRRMHELVTLAVHVAPSDAPVLITGPNGSGKERLAEIVQSSSRRADKPFVQVNAGGLPDQLLEAELFGAEAGAYTGATKLRIGRFEAAHGGTLFLDELGNLSPSGQMKLLRVLQTGEFQRLGSNVTRTASVRLISATNADLRAEIAAGRFREDLYFRLNVIELPVPPLAARPEDILLLAEHFLAQHAAGNGVVFSPEARQALERHDWPGNVRELENRVQRAVLVCQDGPIKVQHLGLDERSSYAPPASAPTPATSSLPPVSSNDGLGSGTLSEVEREAIHAALGRARGVVSRAAAELGLSRQALYRRMERLGIEMERRVR
ncbi:MAG TPA: sigma-54 dependent transcriptional regulator [Polyangiaceae bacterium]|nr:sigma-54 dependent transcriptional regulator [Polyangiaceae bacterium]